MCRILEYFFVEALLCVKTQRGTNKCAQITASVRFFFFTVSPSRHSISEWRMQSIARDSEDSSDEEFFDAHGKHLSQSE